MGFLGLGKPNLKKMKRKCKKCGKPVKIKKITSFVNGFVCPHCGWAAVECYACHESIMKVEAEHWPNIPTQAWLECKKCGKRGRADDNILAWLRHHRLLE